MTSPPAQAEPALDLSLLPEGGFGARNVIWWGNLAFMLIEGTAFVLAMGAYLYLRSRGAAWPPHGDALPSLAWSGVFTVGLLASMVPNVWVSRRARAKDSKGIRLGVLLMTIVGAVLLAVRGFELTTLNVRWDKDAYGSVVWMLMVLHTSHVITDLGDTAVQAVWLFTHEIGSDQYSDVDCNAAYWSFVVLAWVPIYLLVYWFARLP
jgi:heme/copper-type cytochrome/quinol oxidase subunit 3